ncbi:PRK06851 family protein [Caldalkalibacillus salinus]|uniref:PRK06851 family protein n=1 Tax=Caldalkalibacillus salinus TaxID=2803787 RepID=UPI001923806D|nr:PRK06851 family protein [Caldalkalibacillus salinus]
MSKTVRHYYAGGNTARGFYSLYESNLKGLERVFILKGGPGTGKSSLMKALGDKWFESGYDIEVLHCSSDNDSIDGLIIPKLKIGVVDGTPPHIIEPLYPGVVEEYVNVGTAWNTAQLRNHKRAIVTLTDKVSYTFKSAYERFEEALHIHDLWEKYYIDNIDYTAADHLTQKLSQNLFVGQEKEKQNAPDVKHRFLGAATPKGAIDFIPNLTEDIPKRYFIKGRPGCGKSTMLKKLASEAEQRGLDIEVYHCGFDPHSLDMLIVRELGFAIFDSTAPHEYFPERQSDEVVDMYAEVIRSGTDEKYESELKDVSEQYRAKMREATALLAKAKATHDELEAYYIEATDFSKIEAIQAKIYAEMKVIENEQASQLDY